MNRKALLLLGGLLSAVQGLAVQPASSGDPAVLAAETARTLYTVAIGPAPQVGGEAVLTLLGPVSPDAVVQWQRKGTADSDFVNLGSPAATLRISSATAAMSGDQFRCLVSDATGTTTSSVATLVVGPPTISVLSGNGQLTEPGKFNARPFDLAVWDATGAQPLVDTAVTFTVESGGGQLAASDKGVPALAPTLTLQTDADGTVQAYYRHAEIPSVTSRIRATAGTREVFFETTSLAPGADDALALDGSNSTSKSTAASSAAAGKAKSAAGTRSLALQAHSEGKGRDSGDAMGALAQVIGSQLKLRGRTNEYYTVQVSNWAISGPSGL